MSPFVRDVLRAGLIGVVVGLAVLGGCAALLSGWSVDQ